MYDNIIILDIDGKKRMVCQFVIDLSSKEDANKAIKTIREMAKIEEEKKEPEKINP
jgi:hypothetical protein